MAPSKRCSTRRWPASQRLNGSLSWASRVSSVGVAQPVAQRHRRREAAQQRRHRLAGDALEGEAGAGLVEHQHALWRRLVAATLQAQRQRLAGA